MSSVLKALKRLEQGPNRRAAEGGPRQRETGPEKTRAGGLRRLRTRTTAIWVVLVPTMAIGGWLLLKHTLLPTEKSRHAIPIPKSTEGTATRLPAGVLPASKKSDLKPKTGSAPAPRTAVGQVKKPARKTVTATRPSIRELEKQERPPVQANRVPAKTRPQPPATPPRVAADSFRTARAPVSASGSPSRKDLPALEKDSNSYPPRAAGKPAVTDGAVLTGISVQAIAWSKIPAERIAVINNVIVREGGFVEGLQVIQIDLDEVYLKKDEKIFMAKCGQ